MKRISSNVGKYSTFWGIFLLVTFFSLTACQHDIPELDGQPKIAINQKIEKHPFLVTNSQTSPVSASESKEDNQ